MGSTTDQGDSVLRAMADDGSFRVVVASTTNTVRGAASAQSATGEMARHFGDLLTGAVLVRETMAPGLRVQGIVKGPSRAGALVADAHPDGTSRGLVQAHKEASLIVAPGAVMQVMRSLPNGALHQGYVELPRAGVSAALMEYMQQSEQVESVIAVGTLLTEGGVTAAGGYVVQLLPEAHRDALERMTERLAQLAPIDELLKSRRALPRRLVAELFASMEHTILEEKPLRFGCNCSHARVLAGLRTIGTVEIRAMREENKTFDITCDYCKSDYRVSPADLDSILDLN
jgi:molecular chaperone Hsp33